MTVRSPPLEVLLGGGVMKPEPSLELLAPNGEHVANTLAIAAASLGCCRSRHELPSLPRSHSPRPDATGDGRSMDRVPTRRPGIQSYRHQMRTTPEPTVSPHTSVLQELTWHSATLRHGL